MMGTIITAFIVGLIVGALARLIMPGKQNIGVIMTILLGVRLVPRVVAATAVRIFEQERRMAR